MKWFLQVVLGAASPIWADSVTTTDNLTIFGHIDQLDRTMVKLTGRFRTAKGVETRPWQCPRTQVVKIEFNATTFNSGAPLVAGANPGSPTPPPRVTAASSDVAVLRGGENRKCAGIAVVGETVVCGKDALERSRIIRILLGR